MALQADAIATYLAELTVVEDDVLRHARERAASGGMPPVSAESGAFLRFAASWVGAQAAVEIGSGAGYSGVWIARGLAPKGILTTIEADPGHQRLAKETYEEAGVPSRIRAILGRALDVLPRLTDGGYDLAFLDAVKSEYPEYLEHALRLVRPGGVLIADNVDILVDGAQARLVDLSTYGAQVIASGVLKPNQRVRVSMVDERVTLRCQALIVWARFELTPGGGGPRYRGGLEFSGAEEDAVNEFARRHHKR